MCAPAVNTSLIAIVNRVFPGDLHQRAPSSRLPQKDNFQDNLRKPGHCVAVLIVVVVVVVVIVVVVDVVVCCCLFVVYCL